MIAEEQKLYIICRFIPEKGWRKFLEGNIMTTNISNLVPTKVFLTRGVGRHKYKLKSFEDALRQAGVAQQNLVQVSSILPPKCKIISRDKGLSFLTPSR